MKRLSALVFFLFGLVLASAQTSDDQYVQIYSGIQAADTLYDSAQTGAALAKYLEAQEALQRFKKGYPEWNASIVQFRLDYLAERIQTIRSKLPGGAATTAPVESSGQPADSTQLKNQVSALSEQVRLLIADRANLEAKLREALAIQPAAADPKELAKAGDRIKTLEKENDLLQVLVDQAKARGTNAPPGDLGQMKSLLAQANEKLAKESEKSAALERDKQELKKRLDALIPNGRNDAAIEKTTTDLNEANQKLAEQREMLLRLNAEKQALQTRLKEDARTAEALAALKAENALLKKQLAGRAPVTGASSNDLALAQAQIAALQSEKDTLRLERTLLENRVKQLQAAGAQPAIVPFSSGQKTETKRIQELEGEREELQNKLAKANKQIAVLSRKKGQGEVLPQLQSEVASLNARLAVLEAQKAPYTTEELALMKGTPPGMNIASETRRPIAQLPPGSGELVAEAQRQFSARQYEKAEQRYLEVLKKDEKNPLTLANLAAIQLAENRIGEAEQNARKALETAPDDAFALQVLGQIKASQKQYDTAFEYLSQAARIDPNSPQIQNSLGLVLSEKGLRGPAETALRKAIQLQPNYAEAHNNLAVVYLTQKPPLLELARWHYQKAVTAGGANPNLLQMIEAAEKAPASK